MEKLKTKNLSNYAIFENSYHNTLGALLAENTQVLEQENKRLLNVAYRHGQVVIDYQTWYDDVFEPMLIEAKRAKHLALDEVMNKPSVNLTEFASNYVHEMAMIDVYLAHKKKAMKQYHDFCLQQLKLPA